jgi:GNAT superfamily N-acetyltransferase
LALHEGEQKVASLEVGRYGMRLCGAEVVMGGVAGVVTHPAHRQKGLGATMMRAAVARMREERYPVSILFGVPDFYNRFGYVPVLPTYTLTVTTRNAERVAVGAAKVRAATAGDGEALVALYERANAARSGTLRRRDAGRLELAVRPDTDHWWTHVRRALVAETGGEPAGYVLLHGNPAQLRVLEVAVPGEHVETAGLALVDALAKDAVERRLGEIQLPLPPDEPLAQLLRWAGCKVEVSYPANGGGMGRITHLDALAEAIGPALAERAAGLWEDRTPASLELVMTAQLSEPEEWATVGLGGSGPALRVALPQQQLLQLLMGYQGIDALRRRFPEACEERDVAALRGLLPEGSPHMWSFDHF